MKKFKLLNILLVVAFLFSLPVAYAHEIDVKNEAIKIELIDGKVSNNSKILVDFEKLGLEEDTEYTLHYQYVIVENEAYNKYVEEDKLQQQTIKNLLEYYELEKIEDTDDTKIIKEYNDNVKTHEVKKEGFLPAFIETDWIKTGDGTAKLDLTKVPTTEVGYQPYVLWMKVETKDGGSFYGDQVVKVDSPKVDEEAKEESPKTGDEILLVALGALAVAGVMVVSYKKVNA